MVRPAETRFATTQTGEVDPFLARRVLAGWEPKALAIVAGVSVRTAYRWRAEIVSVEEVTVGGWTATFAIRRTLRPLRLTEWTR